MIPARRRPAGNQGQVSFTHKDVGDETVTLHYRKLLIASIVVPCIVLAVWLGMPTLAQSRESAVLDALRTQIRQMDSLLHQIEAFNSQDELKEPIQLAHGVTEDQSESLIDLREAIAGRSSGSPGGDWIPALSAIVAMLGTLSSILFSWRHDMRAASLELSRLRHETSSAANHKAA
jgi:hypothetical protein